MTNLASAAKALLEAQQHYDEVKKYVDNQPAGGDLGFAMQLAWSSSSPEYKTVIYELSKRMRDEVPHKLQAIKADAWTKLLQAERDMQEVAKGHRRA